MREKLRFLGMDVHAETIAVAVAEPDGEVRSLGTIANREDSIRKFIRKLGSPEHLRACYEAGPTGFVLYWQLTQLGVQCDVIAPSLVPKKPGDKVKTDRRDALKLARSHRSDDLTAVWIPDEASEALRDLVRAREAAKRDQLRAQHRLTKFLLRTGRRPPLGVKAWTERHAEWLQQVRYTHPAQEATLLDCMHEVQHMAERVKRLEKSIVEVIQLAPASMQEVIRGLQALRGIAHLSAVTIAVELGNITSRFESARDLMGYSGAFPSEDSSGKRIRRGGITKSGNAHLRRIVVESAWSYRHRPAHRSPVAQATGRASGRDHRDCMESAEPSAQALHDADGSRQGTEKDHDGGRTRTVGLYLGHRDQGRSDGLQTTNGGMREIERTKAKTFQIRKKQKHINP